jgi:DNA transformation protein
MATNSQEFVAFVTEQLAPVGRITSERFFGGQALRSQAVMFAMIMDGSLYFEVDDALRAEFEKSGSRCFSFDSKKGRVDMERFYEVPADALEDQEQLVAFAKAAIAAANKSSASRKPRKRKTGSS